jgi:hypothetical protein
MPCSSHRVQKPVAHLVTALARLHVPISREETAWRRGSRGIKRVGGAEKRKKLRGSFARETGKAIGARAASQTKEYSGFTTLTSRAVGAAQRALSVGGCSREILVMASSLQFAKAGSASTLPQQEKNNSADEQRGRENITDELESLTEASRRVYHR